MICQREGCSRPVPPGRRKYCSVECSKIVNRRSAAERSRMRAEAYRNDRLVKYAPRTCLSCGSSFLSEGPWNRICGGCGERNSVYAYNRSRGNVFSSTDVEDEAIPPKPADIEEPSTL